MVSMDRRTAGWEGLKVEGPDEAGVASLFLNRPSRHNALDDALFRELPLAIASLDLDPCVRVIVLRASGNNFCSGIDLSSLALIAQHDSGGDGSDGARARAKTLSHISSLQNSFSAFEDCRKPIIAAVHGACIGGGVDLITACDLRYCSEDAYFCVKEVDVALVADLGTLQRLPKLIGYGNTMELALTARKVSANEAKQLGLVQDVYSSKKILEEQVTAVGSQIAAKSPLAVMGIKRVLLKSRDETVKQGLDYVATWNAAMLISNDLKEAVQAQMEKRRPAFSRL